MVPELRDYSTTPLETYQLKELGQALHEIFACASQLQGRYVYDKMTTQHAKQLIRVCMDTKEITLATSLPGPPIPKVANTHTSEWILLSLGR